MHQIRTDRTAQNITNDLACIWFRRSLVHISVLRLTTRDCGFPQSLQLKPEAVKPYNRAAEVPGDDFLYGAA